MPVASTLRRAARTLERIRVLPPEYASEQMRDETVEYLDGLANALEGAEEVTGTDRDVAPGVGVK